MKSTTGSTCAPGRLWTLWKKGPTFYTQGWDIWHRRLNKAGTWHTRRFLNPWKNKPIVITMLLC
eukprot:4534285-Prorocentrum_lima.AAC.1